VSQALKPAPPRPSQTRRTVLVAYAGFLLIGWTTVLVPTLIVQVKGAFDQSDTGMGGFFFVMALANMTGPLGGGLLAERIGTRVTLPAGAMLLTLGLAGLALAPTWPVFLLAALPVGVGGGVIDGGMNAVVLALSPHARGNALNRLHLFFAAGASIGPVLIGWLLGLGAAWQGIVLGTGGGAAVLAVLVVTSELPSGRPAPAESSDAGARASRRRQGRLALAPLAFLSLGIGAYVASEIGVSNWLVRFLEAAPVGVATGTLGAFWAGIAVGRLVSSRIADRFDPVGYAAACAFLAAVALLAAVLVPVLPLSIVLFALSGLFSGPVYPMIMAIAGRLYPNRLSAVSGWLATAAVAGSLVYPPLVGVIADGVGITAGMLGLGLLGLVAAGALVVVGATGERPAAARPGAPGN
jgi:fucose permease